MRFGHVLVFSGIAMLAAGATRAATFADCPFSGAMPGYTAEGKPSWENWGIRSFIVTDGDDRKDITPEGAVCTQSYDEDKGKTDGSALEIMENYKESWQQQGAELSRDQRDYVVTHLTKDGKEYWLNASATRDDGYTIRVVTVQPFKPTLLPPSGNDYRLLGHMPGFVASTPTKKNFDEHSFPTADGSVTVRG